VQRGDVWRIETIWLPMPRAEAKAVRNKLAVLVYCEVIKRSPLMKFDVPGGPISTLNIATGFHRITPTLESPVDQYTLYSTIEVQPLMFLVYDHSTGKVLAQKSPSWPGG
jgi:hypothetical protein